MKTARVVIGANFGDEGKGVLTDYYATPGTLVVRYGGGANAGHTVVRDGRRHVFRHFGSGTLGGATTYLSRYFISNPILYFQELQTLDALGIQPKLRVDPAGIVTTPFDMMLNQMVEQHRANGRHGSCGVGINETIKRHAVHPITVNDLRQPTLRERLLNIRTEWVPARLRRLEVPLTEEWRERLDSDRILDGYLERCALYSQQIRREPMASWSGDVVFEGAQGLLLDEDHRFFPYVTHSRTGLRNVVALAQENGIADLEVTYVTRAYLTRHGAGPFPHEEPGLAYSDATNVLNDWQGQLRFGHLDLDLLIESISHDLAGSMPVRHGLAITCLDQVGNQVAFWHYGNRCRLPTPEFVRLVRTAVSAEFCLLGASPQAVCLVRSSR